MPVLDPFILAVAPNGARRTKADHPALPITPAEIALEAKEALEAGASLLHLHVRDKYGQHTLSRSAYNEAIGAVRKAVGDRLIIQATTEAADRYCIHEQIQLTEELVTDSFSIAVGEFSKTKESEKLALATYHRLKEAGILVQHIVYNTADLHRFFQWHRASLLPKTIPFLQLVLGRVNRAGVQRDFREFVEAMPPDGLIWSVCCFGRWEYTAVQMAAQSGGHARVGFENNLFVGQQLAKSNADLVKNCKPAVENYGRRLATADDIRHFFCLSS